jgi:hypothetical protein
MVLPLGLEYSKIDVVLWLLVACLRVNLVLFFHVDHVLSKIAHLLLYSCTFSRLGYKFPWWAFRYQDPSMSISIPVDGGIAGTAVPTVALDWEGEDMPFSTEVPFAPRFMSMFTVSSGLSIAMFWCASCVTTGDVLAAVVVKSGLETLGIASPTSAMWSFIVTLTLSALRVAGVRAVAPIPGVLTAPGVRTVRGVRLAGVLAPDERAVPERRDTRDGFGVGESVSSAEVWRCVFVGTRFRSRVRLWNACFNRTLTSYDQVKGSNHTMYASADTVPVLISF